MAGDYEPITGEGSRLEAASKIIDEEKRRAEARFKLAKKEFEDAQSNLDWWNTAYDTAYKDEEFVDYLLGEDWKRDGH